MLSQLDLSYLNFADVAQAAFWLAVHGYNVTHGGLITFLNGTMMQVIV
jgi:hypothetical protein